MCGWALHGYVAESLISHKSSASAWPCSMSVSPALQGGGPDWKERKGDSTGDPPAYGQLPRERGTSAG